VARAALADLTGAWWASWRAPLAIAPRSALAALADTSMVLAAIAQEDALRLFATTDLHTQFLRPGVGRAILCRAQVVRAGKALVFTRADMHEEDSGKLVATATATFYAP